MKREELNYLTMMEVVYAWLQSNYSTVVTNPKLESLYNELQKSIADMQAGSEQQSKTTKGVTQRKDGHEKQLTELLIAMVVALHAHAVASGLIELQAATNFKKSGIQKLRDLDLISLARNIQALVATHSASLEIYEIDADDISNFGTHLEAFNQSLGTPRLAKVETVGATRSIKEQFAQVKSKLMPELDKMMAPKERKNPELYRAYKSARTIIDRSGGRKTEKPVAEKE